MSALDHLPKMSFGVSGTSKYDFPAERITTVSHGRQYLFEFPKQPGGAWEKFGRGIWLFNITTFFAQGIRGYPQTLFPDTMNGLRGLYERQTSGTFHHPIHGDINAFISSWKDDYNPRTMRNGMRVEMEIVEDQTVDFLSKSSAPAISSLLTSQADFNAQIDKIAPAIFAPKTGPVNIATNQNAQSLFAAMKGLSNAIASLSDTTAMYTGLLQAKAIQLSNLCEQIDHLPHLQGSITMGAIDALHNVWSAATQFTRPQGTPLSTWTVPHTMSVQQIAIDLYGDASRASDIENLNGATIKDPYAVPAQTQIKYFKTPSTVTYGAASSGR